MNVLVLLGSLRAASTNARLAQAAIAALPAGAVATISSLPAHLPFYDEDLDVPDALPDAVAAFRAEVAAADALIVVTPEYNATMSAVLKNAIDWASRPRGAAELAGKRVLVLAATGSPRDALWARESTVRSLTIAGAAPLADTLGIPSSSAAFAPDGSLANPEHADALAGLIAQLTEQRATPAAA